MPRLDFRRSSQTWREKHKPYQRRLLAAVLLLGMVIIVADWARQPGRGRKTASQAIPDVIDNRLAVVSSERMLPESFVAAAASPPTNALPKQEKRYFPGVRPELFADIKDDTPSSSEEIPGCVHLLGVLHKSSLAELRKASEGRVTYAQLFRQPEYYRGQLVTVAGIVRRVHRLELLDNQFGLTHYYQVWLFPYDSPGTPLVVYCIDIPKGFPTGMTLEEEAEATGFFFKRWVYQAKDSSLRTTPTLLAKTLQWQKPAAPTTVPSTVEDDRLIPGVIILALFLAVLTAWVIYFRTRPQRLVLPERLPDFAHKASPTSPEEQQHELPK